jgi:pimeloyl-ACP methyl ester carboxylesterase
MWHKIAGEGTPVVLLHGATGSPESYWAPQIPVLSERFKVILMQYPGYGAQEDDREQFSIPNTARALNELLDELSLEQVNLVGLSLGGAVSLQFALSYPHRVRRMVLADTLSGVRTERFRRFLDYALIGAIEQGDPDLMYDINLIFAFSERYLQESRDELEAGKAGWRSIDVPRYTAMLRAIREWSIDDRLHEIQAPALVLWGSEDIELPRVYSERIASALPYAVMSVIEGAGHKSCSDLPDQFNKAVLTFLLDGNPAQRDSSRAAVAAAGLDRGA